ncbi:type IV secretion system protein [Selenomonas sp. oral taxon 478]|uniref:type IV secretion system protein n=1 Tax=Selenomonas sp. oral taxon 478 TaxID=712538 RepID=UPI000679EB99|nr:type IV secretion system protein [Selenomonas sp. oral taxon 478]AKT54682.1 conjugal transfer protein TrbL [Selenomonas sp. oral taxon 478]
MHRYTETMRHILPLGIFVLVAVLVLADGTTASAAASFSSDIGLKGGDNAFQNNLTTMANGMFTVARIISTIMIALAGIMIAFNVETANKTTWNIILGIGLALNFGTVLMSAFGGSFGGADQAPFEYRMHVTADEDSKWYDFLQPFTRTYIDYTKSGAVSIMPVAAKLLLVLTAISASVKISLDLISGDKMKFLVQILLETGLYLFLILNWYGHGIDIMGSLCSGFQAIGYHAGGYSDGMGSGSLIANAVTMFTTGYGAAQEAFSIWSPISGLFTILCLVIMFILLVLAGIEMLMAKIEFFTMAMITIPLIPFAALPQTKFLFERALGAMFNLAIKVAVISFLTAMSSRILTDYCDEFAKIAQDPSKGGIIGNMPVLIQAVVVSLLLYLLIKKIPDLVQGLLSGSPSLNGASMTQTAKNVTSAGVAAGAAIASGGTSVAGNMAKSAVAGYGQGGGGIAGLARAGANAMNTGTGMMMSAAGRGMGHYARDSMVGKSTKAGIEAAQKYFGVGANQQAPTATGLAVSGGKSIAQSAKNGVKSAGSGIATVARGAATVANDVARDISKLSPIK